MKKIGIGIVVLLAFFACNNQAKIFSGDYSYKTSGRLTIADDSTSVSQDLAETIGQLNVVDLKSAKKDSILLIFNQMRGEIISVRAAVNGDSIFLKPYKKVLPISVDNKMIDCEMNISGKGIRYENSIVLKEIYNGLAVVNDSVSKRVSSNEITTFAKQN